MELYTNSRALVPRLKYEYVSYSKIRVNLAVQVRDYVNFIFSELLKFASWKVVPKLIQVPKQIWH